VQCVSHGGVGGLGVGRAGGGMPNFGLVCLHACGDLVPNMLMAFANDPGV